MHNILVIDDDRKIRELLKTYLDSNGFNTDVAEDTQKARSLIAKNEYDILVVDVMMPGETGIEFTERIINEINTPILMLTAMGETSDRIKGLEAGADDYLPKPFDPKELFLRINKLITRTKDKNPVFSSNINNENSGNIIPFGNFTFDLKSKVLRQNNENVYLSSTETELLFILCSNLNQEFSREDLSKKFNGISERSIDVQITRLRKRIEDDPKEPKFIQTVWGKGYAFRN